MESQISKFQTAKATVPAFVGPSKLYRHQGRALTNKVKDLLVDEEKACRQGCLCFGLCGPHQCCADTGADTWQKQALYHMPG